jgi:hypothetical protein
MRRLNETLGTWQLQQVRWRSWRRQPKPMGGRLGVGIGYAGSIAHQPADRIPRARCASVSAGGAGSSARCPAMTLPFAMPLTAGRLRHIAQKRGNLYLFAHRQAQIVFCFPRDILLAATFSRYAERAVRPGTRDRFIPAARFGHFSHRQDFARYSGSCTVVTTAIEPPPDPAQVTLSHLACHSFRRECWQSLL